MEKSVKFTGTCANEIIPSINRSLVYKAKEGLHVRIININCLHILASMIYFLNSKQIIFYIMKNIIRGYKMKLTLLIQIPKNSELSHSLHS
jgi:hypothetical protein